jgi:hypothetical protein
MPDYCGSDLDELFSTAFIGLMLSEPHLHFTNYLGNPGVGS